MNEILKEAQIENENLLNNMKTIMLSTVSKDGIPNVSYAPSAIDSDKNFYIYISNLSKHSKNLKEFHKSSIMIIEDEKDSENIFGRKRLTLDVEVTNIKRDSDLWNTKIKLLEDKYSETMSFLVKLTDFNLFKLTPTNGLLVYGFGKAFKYIDGKLIEPKHINNGGHTKKK